jgi:pimeloyl-ACP methyl ester carboxylesterase
MYLNIEDKRIYYNIKKSKSNRAIIFVHGSGGSSNTWKNQMKFEIGYDLISFDLPSHGNSSEYLELSLNLYVEILDHLIRSLNYEEVVLCGHSLGGAIVQSYYYLNPKRVIALILIGTGSRLRVSPAILEGLKSDYQEFLKSMPSGAFNISTSADIINDYIKETSAIGAEVTFADFSICDTFDTIEKTSSINIPCLIIVGKSDKLTPIKYSEFFHNKIENSDLHIIDDAGHMVMLEKPVEVNNAIKSFFTNRVKR